MTDITVFSGSPSWRLRSWPVPRPHRRRSKLVRQHHTLPTLNRHLSRQHTCITYIMKWYSYIIGFCLFAMIYLTIYPDLYLRLTFLSFFFSFLPLLLCCMRCDTANLSARRKSATHLFLAHCPWSLERLTRAASLPGRYLYTFFPSPIFRLSIIMSNVQKPCHLFIV